MRRGVRLSFQPLSAYLRVHYRPDMDEAGNYRGFGDLAMGDMCAVSRQCIRHWRSHGLGWLAADTVAIHLGLHPCLIWGEAWWALDKEEQAA